MKNHLKIKSRPDGTAEIIVNEEPILFCTNYTLRHRWDECPVLEIEQHYHEIEVDADGVEVKRIMFCPGCGKEFRGE